MTLLFIEMEQVGVDPARVKMAWVSASEGSKFAELIQELSDELREIGPMEQFKRRDEL